MSSSVKLLSLDVLSRIIIFLATVLSASNSNATEKYIIDYIADVIIDGSATEEMIGDRNRTSGVMDFNGDGIDDLALGVSGRTNCDCKASAYIIFGSTHIPARINLSESTEGILIVDHPTLEGTSIGGIGDFNGDGFADISFGHTDAKPNNVGAEGEVFILYGGTDIQSPVLISTEDTPGVHIKGYRWRGWLGYSTSGPGDLNGDGLNDAFLGSPGNFGGDLPEAFLIYGGTDVPSSITIDDWGTYGVRIVPRESLVRQFATRVTHTGDVNGDSLPDLLLGECGDSFSDYYVGNAYLIYGATDLPTLIELDKLGSLGVHFSGNNAPASIANCFSVKQNGIRDINGDGFDDFVLTSTCSDYNGTESAGRVFVIFGAPDLPQEITFQELSNYGFMIYGIASYGQLGWCYPVGDLNNDGFGDFSLTDYSSSNVFIVLGRENFDINTPIAVDEVSDIIIYPSVPTWELDSAAQNIGDFNHDGLDDLLIGSKTASPNGKTFAGQVYIIFGGKFFGPSQSGFQVY